MSYSVSALLTRHLPDCFGEIDPARRRAAMDEIFDEDAVYYDLNGAYRGRDEIHRIAGALKASHPDFRYQPIAPPEELGNGGRDGCRVALVMHHLTPGLISLSLGTAGLPPFIAFSTSSPKLDSELTADAICAEPATRQPQKFLTHQRARYHTARGIRANAEQTKNATPRGFGGGVETEIGGLSGHGHHSKPV